MDGDKFVVTDKIGRSIMEMMEFHASGTGIITSLPVKTWSDCPLILQEMLYI